MTMDWDDPVARLALIEDVGTVEYNKRIAEHFERSAVARVNGYRIRPINTGRYGMLYNVDGDSRAFGTQAEAEAHAATLTPGPFPAPEAVDGK